MTRHTSSPRAASVQKSTRWSGLLALAALACAAGCAGAPVKPTGEGVNVSLRRIDVVNANFDRMTLEVVVALENTTDSAVGASADVSLALLGEAATDTEDSATEQEGSNAQEAAGDAEGAQDAPSGAAAAGGDGGSAEPVDGTRHKGTGAGTAPARNTSELPVRVEVPLPSDPALLEQVLDWRKVRVHVDGTVRLGLEQRPLVGVLEMAPPHLPEVRLKEAQVASANNGAAGTGFFTLLVENKNPFQVTVSRLAWTITIQDKELAPSSSSGPTQVESDPIDANTVGEYPAEVLIDEAAFGKGLKALLKQRSVPYVVQGTMEVRGIQRPFRFTGEMKFAR